MKITHNKVGRNLNTSDKGKGEIAGISSGKPDVLSELGKSDKSEKSEKSSSARLSLSERAQDIAKAKEVISKTADVRADRVAELQSRIDKGDYKVSASDIADKLVDEEIQWS